MLNNNAAFNNKSSEKNAKKKQVDVNKKILKEMIKESRY